MAIDVDKVLADDPEVKPAIDDYLKRYGGSLADYAFVPMFARYQNYLLGVRRSDNNLVGELEITVPFPADFPLLSNRQSEENDGGSNGDGSE